MSKRRVRRCPSEFRRIAVERLKSCDNIVSLERELGVHRRLFTSGKKKMEPAKPGEEPLPSSPELLQQLRQLRRLLEEKTLEVDFFKGALQKVEARRKRRGNSGEKASTTRSSCSHEVHNPSKPGAPGFEGATELSFQ